MTASTKYRICFIGAGLGIPAAAYCLSRIAGAGYGDPASAKLWFVTLMIVVAVGCCLAVGRYYYKEKLKYDYDADAVAVRTLAGIANQSDGQSKRTTQKSR